jgi:hypothetical protein
VRREGVGIAGKIVERPEIRFRLRIFPSQSQANATTNETAQPQPNTTKNNIKHHRLSH